MADSKKDKKKKHHRHHQRRRDDELNFDIPGVTRVTLREETQAFLHCLVGEGITSEKPWKYIRKDLIEELLESDEECEFLQLKEKILKYVGEEMLIGYIPDESRPYDEFYFCTEEEATRTVDGMVRKLEEKQKSRLDNTIHRRIHKWHSYGSEEQVDDFVYKNNRPLYVIELETTYPMLFPKVEFRMHYVKDQLDGYAELLQPARYPIPNIIMSRIDNVAQAAPHLEDNEAQTTCTYPKNQWTQYEYEYEKIKRLSEDFINDYKKFVGDNMDNFYDNMTVNSFLNLYTDDYRNLVKNKMFSTTPTEAVAPEIMSLADIRRCKDKVISSLSWHPTWTGTVAISYASLSPCAYQKHFHKKNLGDAKMEIFDNHLTLIWSFKDVLYPKLILESDCDVLSLAFCPHNENILAGGLHNGQVIIWDITNKLEKVEEVEVLTTAQQKYRGLMFSFMKWMINTKDISVIRPTVVSDINYCHRWFVTSIIWLHPLYEVSKTGKIEEVADLEHSEIPKTSLQFVTASTDGTLLFWDLLCKPIYQAGDYKPQKKLRRLKKRPSALTVDVSPFRILHRNLRPHYMIIVNVSNTMTKCSIRCLDLFQPPLRFVCMNKDPEGQNNFTDRHVYAANITLPQEAPEQKFVVGTASGYVLICTWDGFDYLQGDVIATEEARIVSKAIYHDGPVNCIMRNPFCPQLILTVGGKIFCIWKEDLKERPVLWRRSRCEYTYANWGHYSAGIFELNKTDGNRETWNVIIRTDNPCNDVSYSGDTILISLPHSLPLDRNVVGISDDKGYLRLVVIPGESKFLGNEIRDVAALFDSNVKRKQKFLIWQDEWTNMHAGWIKQQKEEAIAEAKRKEAEMALQKQQQEEMQAILLREEERKAASKQRPPPGQYLQWAREQWVAKEEDRMAAIILSKKLLNKEMLVRQQAPLKKLEEEEEKRKGRQRERLQKADEIFTDTITMLFPDLMQRVLEKKIDPYTKDIDENLKKNCIDAFDDISNEAMDLIMENPFVYEYDFYYTLQSNKDHKAANDADIGGCTHRLRHEAEILARTSYAADEPRKSYGHLSNIGFASIRKSDTSAESVRSARPSRRSTPLAPPLLKEEP